MTDAADDSFSVPDDISEITPADDPFADNDRFVDATAEPRAGEELDAEKLERFLKANVPGASGDLEIAQFPAGHSNLTFSLRMGGDDWVLRRPPFGAETVSGHDMGREFKVLDKLGPVFGPAPTPVIFEGSGDVIGAPFYVMERISGVILRSELPPGLDLGPDVMDRLSLSVIDNLAAIHTLDYETVGLGDLGRPDGYVRRQIEGWTQRYQAAQTDEISDLDDVASWLGAHMPAERGAALIHNDYKFDNIVLDRNDVTRIIGVLDWEMATIGDPLMDLGTALGYWVELGDDPALLATAFGPTSRPGAWSRARLIEHYADATGFDVSGIGFYYVYALFKLAAILQQIYYRYAQGFTDDARFAQMIEVVKMLGRVAADTAER